MKNIINNLFVFSVLIFLVPNIIFATSGACSSHGGVNCSISNSYKSVVCNDGNSDGLTAYSDLQECKTVPTCDNGQVTAFSASRGLSGSSFGQSASSNCESINTTPTALPVNIYNDIDMVKYCVSKHGYNSKYNFDKDSCGCKDGYLFDSNKMCVPSKKVLRTIFEKYLSENLDKLSVYKDVLEVDTIVDMAYESKNYDKTFNQLILEAYGNKIKSTELIPEDNVKEVVTPTSTKIDTYQKPLPNKVILPEPIPTTSPESFKTTSNNPEVKPTSFFGVITGKAVSSLQNIFVSFRNIFSHKNSGK